MEPARFMLRNIGCKELKQIIEKNIFDVIEKRDNSKLIPFFIYLFCSNSERKITIVKTNIKGKE